MPKLNFSAFYSPTFLSARDGQRGDARAFWRMIANDLAEHKLEERLDEDTRTFLVQAFIKIAEGEDPRKIMLLAGKGLIPKETEKQIEIATAVRDVAFKEQCSIEDAVDKVSKSYQFAGGDETVMKYYKKWNKHLR